MRASEEPLVRLEDVSKVFLTDEVETHALAGVGLCINRGEYVSISGPSGSRSMRIASASTNPFALLSSSTNS